MAICNVLALKKNNPVLIYGFHNPKMNMGTSRSRIFPMVNCGNLNPIKLSLPLFFRMFNSLFMINNKAKSRNRIIARNSILVIEDCRDSMACISALTAATSPIPSLSMTFAGISIPMEKVAANIRIWYPIIFHTNCAGFPNKKLVNSLRSV